jgi:hypothetical protein
MPASPRRGAASMDGSPKSEGAAEPEALRVSLPRDNVLRDRATSWHVGTMPVGEFLRDPEPYVLAAARSAREAARRSAARSGSGPLLMAPAAGPRPGAEVRSAPPRR